MAPLPTEMRQIIALDLDNFYVGVERLRNPSLVGKPVGIKQKGILATCSYEARAKGVGKLMSLKQAKEKCPELIVVLGEDLTPYRHYSRLVFNLVRSIVGPSVPVEKLGMDELFIDCSSLVKVHLGETTFRRRADGQIWFSLSSGEPGLGFWYAEDRWAGHRLEDEGLEVEAGPQSTSPSSSNNRPNPYLVASHLALHLRTQIQDQIGLGTSGGVSHNKLLSKLIASTHKPADQTSLSPLFLPSTSPPSLHPSTSYLIQVYLDPLTLRKLPGFGHTITSKIIQTLSSLDPPPPPELDPDAPTVLTTRTHLSLSTFKSLFTPRLAPILYSLLHGDDPSPVVPSPEFPAQIGVEESYASNHFFEWRRFTSEVERLLTSLLVRFEEELVVVGDEKAGKRRWVRWPMKLRMEIRRGWDSPNGREGKSVDMPVGVFDLGVEVEKRVRMLMGRKVAGGEEENEVGGTTRKVGGVVGSLMRGLIKEGEGGKEFELYVINFAALSLSTHAPGPSIEQWTKSSSSSTPTSSKGKHRAPPDLDLSILNELPSDLRAEVLSSYGLSERDVAELLKDRRPLKLRKVFEEGQGSAVEKGGGEGQDLVDETVGGVMEERPELETMEADAEENTIGWRSDLEEDGEDADEEEWGADGEEEKEACSICRLRVFPFALAAHALFHVADG